MRERRAKHRKRGVEFEEPLPGGKVNPAMLTEERVKRLDALGFVWVAQPPKANWDDRFNELVEVSRYPST